MSKQVSPLACLLPQPLQVNPVVSPPLTSRANAQTQQAYGYCPAVSFLESWLVATTLLFQNQQHTEMVF